MPSYMWCIFIASLIYVYDTNVEPIYAYVAMVGIYWFQFLAE